MKVFISSVISGYFDYREADAAAIRSLRHEVIRAEDFGAQPISPRQACLAAVRASDLVVLLLGGSYGPVQSPGLSATHEEWREAVEDSKPVLVFVERHVPRESKQVAFIDEVESWSGGRLRDSYDSPSQLQEKVVQALNDFSTIAPSERIVAEIRSRAEAALPFVQGGSYGGYHLTVAVAAGPRRTVMRPSEIQSESLSAFLQRQAMFGANAILDRHSSTRWIKVQGRLELRQDGSMLSVDEHGTVLVIQPALNDAGGPGYSFSGVIVEDLCNSVSRGLRFAAEILDEVDSLLRIPFVVPIVAISDVRFTFWRSRAEHEASPNSYSPCGVRAGFVGSPDPQFRHRSTFLGEAEALAEDLVELLHRTGDSLGFY